MLVLQVMFTRCMRGARVCSSVARRTRPLVSGISELRPPSVSSPAHHQVSLPLRFSPSDNFLLIVILKLNYTVR